MTGVEKILMVLLCLMNAIKPKIAFPSASRSPPKTGFAILELQNKLPKARIVYISATGTLEPHHISYMVRLGLWGEGTPFRGKNFFYRNGLFF